MHYVKSKHERQNIGSPIAHEIQCKKSVFTCYKQVIYQMYTLLMIPVFFFFVGIFHWKNVATDGMQ